MFLDSMIFFIMKGISESMLGGLFGESFIGSHYLGVVAFRVAETSTFIIQVKAYR
jgi:hypothetical protein